MQDDVHSPAGRGEDPLPKGLTVVPAEPALRRHVYAAWRTHATRRNVIRAAVEAFEAAAKQLAAPAARAQKQKRR